MSALTGIVLGGRVLRSLVLAYSHNTGMSTLGTVRCVQGKSITQTENVYQQLMYG